MKTIKEKYAPFFKELAKARNERRFHEALSIPWVVIPFNDFPDQDWNAPSGEELLRLQLPFSRQVMVGQYTGENGTGNSFVSYLECTSENKIKEFFVKAQFSSGVWAFFSSGSLQEYFDVGIGNFGNGRADRVHLVQSWGIYVKLFSVLFNSPKTHMAAVQPVNPMKPVQWKKSQEHFVFLTSAHPVNCDGAARKQDYDPAVECVRQAHWRRGHTRTYTHERYKDARGKTRWVREVWIGPKEWENKRSRQTYRIVEKPTPPEQPES